MITTETTSTQHRFRFVLALSLLVAAGLACNLFTDVRDTVDDARQTVDAVATRVQDGRELVETGQAAVTQILGNEWVQTAQALAAEKGPSAMATLEAFATEHGPAAVDTVEALATQYGPSLIATARAFATEQGPAAIGTAEALATQYGPDAVATLQAIATERGSSLVQTAQAVETRLAPAPDELPADIPLVSGELENLFISQAAISYQTAMEYEAVEDFYRTQMPANGWQADQEGSLRTDQAAILRFEKPDRRVIVTLSTNPINGHTFVLIGIQAK